MMRDEQTLRIQIKEAFTEKLVSCFLEILIIAGFRDSSFSGYDALRFINERYGILLSPGRMYSTMYAMERKKLVEGSHVQGKRVYRVTDFGKMTLDVVTSSDEIQAFIVKVLSKQM
jgi:DNA-binding PadR family transcriptional regulator